MSTDKKETPATVEVVLLKDHKHRGKDEKKGAKISVTEQERQFLLDREIIANNSPEVPKVATETKAKS